MGYVFEDPKENIDIRSYYKYAKPTPMNKLVMETYEGYGKKVFVVRAPSGCRSKH